MKSSLDASYRQLAARYIRRQIRQLADQIDGIRRAEDVEFVHRARVASRRLRAAVKVFADCFRPEDVNRWVKEIRGVGRGLGDARDMDVQVGFVSDVLCRLQDPACMPGTARVLVRCVRRREKLQPKVLAAMSRLLSSRALHQMLATTKKMLPEGKGAENLPPSPALFQHAQQHILARLEELHAFRACLADPEDYEQHHAMRIAAKRLRYTMEIYRPVYAGRSDGAIDAVKQLQTLLGEIHDCDVWVEQLDAMLQKQAKRLRSLYGHAGPLARLKAGIEYLQQERRRHRRKLFQTLVHYWERLDRKGAWDRLTRIVRSAGDQDGGKAAQARRARRKPRRVLP